MRIARRQPKFDFRQARAQSTSPLFDGFDHPDAETAERPDQPVLIRLGTHDERRAERRLSQGGRRAVPLPCDHPRRSRGRFLHPDQQALLRNFVSQRGGGLLMLGGPDSFADGKYDRTPVGELLPVYLNRPSRGRTKTRSIAWC